MDYFLIKKTSDLFSCCPNGLWMTPCCIGMPKSGAIFHCTWGLWATTAERKGFHDYKWPIEIYFMQECSGLPGPEAAKNRVRMTILLDIFCIPQGYYIFWLKTKPKLSVSAFLDWCYSFCIYFSFLKEFCIYQFVSIQASNTRYTFLYPIISIFKPISISLTKFVVTTQQCRVPFIKVQESMTNSIGNH